METDSEIAKETKTVAVTITKAVKNQAEAITKAVKNQAEVMERPPNKKQSFLFFHLLHFIEIPIYLTPSTFPLSDRNH